MELISQEVCATCKSLEKCIEAAAHHHNSQIRCVNFGYIKEYVDDVMTHIKNEFENEFNKYMNYLIGHEES